MAETHGFLLVLLVPISALFEIETDNLSLSFCISAVVAAYTSGAYNAPSQHYRKFHVEHTQDTPKPTKEPLTPIGLKMPPDLLARIDAAAAELGLSRTAWLRMTAIQALPAKGD